MLKWTCDPRMSNKEVLRLERQNLTQVVHRYTYEFLFTESWPRVAPTIRNNLMRIRDIEIAQRAEVDANEQS